VKLSLLTLSLTQGPMGIISKGPKGIKGKKGEPGPKGTSTKTGVSGCNDTVALGRYYIFAYKNIV